MAADNIEKLRCFKAYDVRGRVPDELDKDLARRIGQAFATCFSPARVVLGHDIRISSPDLSRVLAEGLMAAGSDVVDLGLCGTEEVYFATSHLKADGGIMVTASHNPAAYNGMKFVGPGAKPISSETGLTEVEQLATAGDFAEPGRRGTYAARDLRPAFIDHLLGYVDLEAMRPLRLVVNAGNGCAGPLLDLLETRLPFSFVKLLNEPDGSFPNGVPNPLLPENRELTSIAVLKHKADLGIAWDGDFDRCFLFDENGAFIEGYYLVGLLARMILEKAGPAKIIHDPRLVWNTREIVRRAGGTPVMARTGHAFIKEIMRAEDAVYGGEMSGHHYFREFAYCDSGMIPWLLVCEMLSRSAQPLSGMLADCMAAFPVSGEINSRVADPDAAINRVEDFYQDVPAQRDYIDGFSLEAESFRFNIRKSNTEPVLRLNVESRGDQALLENKTKELLDLIRG